MTFILFITNFYFASKNFNFEFCSTISSKFQLVSSFLYTSFFLPFFTGDSSRCIEFERSRQKIREGIRNRIYSRTIILPVIARHSSKEIAILRNSTKDMSQVPLIAAEETSTTESPTCNMVILEVKEEKEEKTERNNKRIIYSILPSTS